MATKNYENIPALRKILSDKQKAAVGSGLAGNTDLETQFVQEAVEIEKRIKKAKAGRAAYVKERDLERAQNAAQERVNALTERLVTIRLVDERGLSEIQLHLSTAQFALRLAQEALKECQRELHPEQFEGRALRAAAEAANVAEAVPALQ